MHMKTTIIAFAAAALALTSCSDWLETSSSTQIKGDDLLTTEAGFQDALTGIYLNLASSDLYGKNLTWYFAELMAEPYYTRVTSQEAYVIMADNGYATSTSESYRDAIWSRAYNTVANINYMLRALDAESGALGSRAKSLFYGEAYALRAFIHLDLMRLYGYGAVNERADFGERVTIPYVAEYTKDTTPQKSYAETMAAIVADLKRAVEFLADDPVVTGESSSSEFNADGFWSNRKYHLNYYAAKALLARAYMWEGSPESRAEAVALAREVIDAGSGAYTWNTYRISDTSVDRTFSTEHLFTLNVYEFATIVSSFYTDPAYNSSFETLLLPAGDVYAIYNAKKDAWDDDWNWLGTVPDFGYDDYRYQLHQRQTTYEGSDYFFSYKYYQTTDSYYAYKDMIPLIKISEMYYILAEDYLLEGDTENALRMLNTVRAHRGLTVELTEDLIDNELYTSVRTEFLKELMREFQGEGQLIYYLKRWQVASYSDEGLWFEYDRTFDDSTYVLPYPQDEVTIAGRVQ